MSGKTAPKTPKKIGRGYERNLDAGPFQPMISSFELHLRAEKKSPKTIRTYLEAAQWMAAEYLIPQVSLTLDASTANIVIFAVTAYAGDREAHAREVEQFGRGLPEGSYGRRNREAIAAREMHTAQRLRAVERAYQMAIDHDAAISYDPAAAINLTDHSADREMELE